MKKIFKDCTVTNDCSPFDRISSFMANLFILCLLFDIIPCRSRHQHSFSMLRYNMSRRALRHINPHSNFLAVCQSEFLMGILRMIFSQTEL